VRALLGGCHRIRFRDVSCVYDSWGVYFSTLGFGYICCDFLFFFFLKKLMGERNAHKYITIKNK
jgi:hypothetical protein